MTWELLITLCALAVAGIGLGVFAAVKSAKSANAKDVPSETAEITVIGVIGGMRVTEYLKIVSF